MANDLVTGLRATLEAITPRAPANISELVSIFGGPGRGGGVSKLAGAIGVAPRTVQRWLAKAEGRGVKQTRTISADQLALAQVAGQDRLAGETIEQLKQRGARVRVKAPVIAVSDDERTRPDINVRLSGRDWEEIADELNGPHDDLYQAFNNAILNAYDVRGILTNNGAEITGFEALDIL